MPHSREILPRLIAHQTALKSCTRCPDMIGPVVLGQPVVSKVLQIGQAPGPYEGTLGHPFAWTAGKTLFKWYASIGIEEAAFRRKVYMAAVCRCFPGKHAQGGDRVPNRNEIGQCSAWLREEIDMLQPELIIPVGKLAIAQFLKPERLDRVIGQTHAMEIEGRRVDILPLPHPSGLSTWFKVEPGKTLLRRALQTLSAHPVWQTTFDRTPTAQPQ